MQRSHTWTTPEDWRLAQLAEKHAPDPIPADWRETAADDAGVPRFGEI